MAQLFRENFEAVVLDYARLGRTISHATGPTAPQADADFDRPPATIRTEPKTGRNDPCPCGSGKKFKRCCGAAGRSVH